MANRGYADLDDHSSPSGGEHDTGHDRRTEPCDIQARTSVAAQVRAGGFTNDRPYSDDGSVPPPHKYQGGSATGSDRADYPGVTTPKSGTTY